MRCSLTAMVAAVSAALLGACATDVDKSPAKDTKTMQNHPQSICHLDSQDLGKGLTATEQALFELKMVSGAGIVRKLTKNQPVTLEFNPERANVVVDENDKIIRVYCG